jgi:uncharacterized integral membrane protein (TIGR00698 family)
VGIVLALTGLTAFDKQSQRLSRLLIQICVVLLGLRLDLRDLIHEAGGGMVLAVLTVFGTLAAGLLLGRVFKVGREVSLLVASGTSICGGSAIAAVGSSIGAESSAMAVATAAIFILNAVGLFALPVIGRALHMSNVQFGTWAGIALHDISSVAGAGKAFVAGRVDPMAIDTAMVVKLTRVLWITPIALAARWWWRRGQHGPAIASSTPFPWFILLFIAASAVRTLVPGTKDVAGPVLTAAGLGFQLALFLIGAGLSRKALASVGWRALAQAVLLWLLIAGASLAMVRGMLAENGTVAM